MKNFVFLFLCFPIISYGQDLPANEFFDADVMASARESMRAQSGNSTNYLVMADRFESGFEDGNASLLWDVQAWLGKDLKRFWFKTEGKGYGNSDTEEESEVQFLYSKALSPFWDVQLGWRHEFTATADRDYAVLGVQGLAPQWFELDMAAFISEKGELSTRLEAEYDLLITQRLVLQPTLALNYSFSEDLEIGAGQGLNEVAVGLRLRYELKRNVAPYLGLSWSRAYGATADLLQRAGAETDEFSVVVGLRFWY